MSKEITVFAETTYRNQVRKFGIKTDDRRRHMYLIGKTGMGKSTILENMIIEDIRAGHGVAVVDPHGDLAEKIIEFIPTSRINDVIYFNPADMNYPFAFNVVEQVEPHLRHLVASGLIGVFKKLWADSWGPRLEYILRNAILAVLDYPGSTLLAVTRMLSDKTFRKKVIVMIQDPVVKAFWVDEFAGYADKFASEAVSPIQNKVGQFLSSSLIRNIVGQVKSSIDMREIMDQGKILIMNLSKGRIGEDNSAMLGAMVITKIQLAAMSRVDILEKDRKDFFLYIDEFQNFSTESFANILSEARKYRLSLIMAHQYIEQLNDIVKAAVFGNVGTLVVFRVGATDAEELVKEFTPVFTEEDIVNLPKYEMYLKLMIDGIASDPFSARGLRPLAEEEKTHNVEKVIAISRERYAQERTEVERKIMRWHENGGDDELAARKDEEPVKEIKKMEEVPKTPTSTKPKIQSESRDSKPTKQFPPRQAAVNNTNNFRTEKPIERSHNENKNKGIGENQNRRVKQAEEKVATEEVYKFDTNCFRCGKNTKTSFKPDGIRPVYCKDCLASFRNEKRGELESRKKAKEEELRKLENRNKPTINQADVSVPQPEISLSALTSSVPVGFKNSNHQTEKNNQPKEPVKQENDIKENEDVVFE